MFPAIITHHKAPEYWTVQEPGTGKAPLIFGDFGRLLDVCRLLDLDPIPQEATS